jgi:HSP20 family molecular chaperone IbpA
MACFFRILRQVPLGLDVAAETVEKKYKKGVLPATLPKPGEANT